MFCHEPLEALIDRLFQSAQFTLQLDDRITSSISNALADRIHPKIPQLSLTANNLADEITENLHQIIDMSLRDSLTNQFVSLSEQAVQVRAEVYEVREQVNGRVRVLEEMLEEVRKKGEGRGHGLAGGVDPEVRRRMSTKFEAVVSDKKENHDIADLRRELAAMKLEIAHMPKPHHLQELIASIKSRMEQSHQKLLKDLVTLATRLDSLPISLLTDQKLQKTIKKQLDSRLNPLIQVMEQQRKFTLCYQQQFTDLQRGLKKYVENALESVWKALTDVRFNVEELKYHSEEGEEKKEVVPEQGILPFGFLFR